MAFPGTPVGHLFDRGMNPQPRPPGLRQELGVWVSGAEIQTSAVDTRIAVWVSTAEKFLKIVLGETRRIFLESLGGSQHQLCIKTRPLFDLL